MRGSVLKISIPVILVALLVLGVFWWTTWRWNVTVGYAEHWIRTSPPTFVGVTGEPQVSCRHAKGGFFGLSRVDDCTAAFASGAAYHCQVWNPWEGVGDAMKCNPTPFHRSRSSV